MGRRISALIQENGELEKARDALRVAVESKQRVMEKCRADSERLAADLVTMTSDRDKLIRERVNLLDEREKWERVAGENAQGWEILRKENTRLKSDLFAARAELTLMRGLGIGQTLRRLESEDEGKVFFAVEDNGAQQVTPEERLENLREFAESAPPCVGSMPRGIPAFTPDPAAVVEDLRGELDNAGKREVELLAALKSSRESLATATALIERQRVEMGKLNKAESELRAMFVSAVDLLTGAGIDGAGLGAEWFLDRLRKLIEREASGVDYWHRQAVELGDDRDKLKAELEEARASIERWRQLARESDRRGVAISLERDAANNELRIVRGSRDRLKIVRDQAHALLEEVKAERDALRAGQATGAPAGGLMGEVDRLRGVIDSVVEALLDAGAVARRETREEKGAFMLRGIKALIESNNRLIDTCHAIHAEKGALRQELNRVEKERNGLIEGEGKARAARLDLLEGMAQGLVSVRDCAIHGKPLLLIVEACNKVIAWVTTERVRITHPEPEVCDSCNTAAPALEEGSAR